MFHLKKPDKYKKKTLMNMAPGFIYFTFKFFEFFFLRERETERDKERERALVHACLWVMRPEVGVGCLPLWLSIFFIYLEIGSLR